MQFGLFMMPLHPPHRAFADGYDRDVAQIVLADSSASARYGSASTSPSGGKMRRLPTCSSRRRWR
jgi:hypothetical protein